MARWYVGRDGNSYSNAYGYNLTVYPERGTWTAMAECLYSGPSIVDTMSNPGFATEMKAKQFATKWAKAHEQKSPEELKSEICHWQKVAAWLGNLVAEEIGDRYEQLAMKGQVSPEMAEKCLLAHGVLSGRKWPVRNSNLGGTCATLKNVAEFIQTREGLR